MLRNFLPILFVIMILFINPGHSFAQAWSYLGFARVSTDTIFYIFVLSEKTGTPGEQKITQKHVFSVPQKLMDGSPYSSILISRTLNCSAKTISTDRAVFSNGVGAKVAKYENKNTVKSFINISGGKHIDQYLFDKYCAGQA